jgi:hypothetical protein
MCDYYMKCNNAPIGTIQHIVLGAVAICQRCYDRQVKLGETKKLEQLEGKN